MKGNVSISARIVRIPSIPKWEISVIILDAENEWWHIGPIKAAVEFGEENVEKWLWEIHWLDGILLSRSLYTSPHPRKRKGKHEREEWRKKGKTRKTRSIKNDEKRGKQQNRSRKKNERRKEKKTFDEFADIGVSFLGTTKRPRGKPPQKK